MRDRNPRVGHGHPSRAETGEARPADGASASRLTIPSTRQAPHLVCSELVPNSLGVHPPATAAESAIERCRPLIAAGAVDGIVRPLSACLAPDNLIPDHINRGRFVVFNTASDGDSHGPLLLCTCRLSTPNDLRSRKVMRAAKGPAKPEGDAVSTGAAGVRHTWSASCRD